MKTERTEVTETLEVWAIPKSSWVMENDPNQLPFRYEARIGKAYQDGAVKLYEEKISLYVPEGIDLLEKAVETLQDEMKNVRKETKERLEDLQDQVNKLLLIEYKPEAEVI